MLPTHLQDLLSEDRIRKIVGSFKPTALEDATLRPAAVLVPLLPTDAGLSVVLTVRTHRVEHHKEEISFPGGGRDPEDADLLATAMREAQEEVGIAPEDVEVLGQLDDIQTTSGYLVGAFVGFIPGEYPFRARAWEVAEVLVVPLAHLLDPAHITFDQRLYREAWEQAPTYHYDDHAVWGATARVLQQLLGLISGEFAQRVPDKEESRGAKPL